MFLFKRWIKVDYRFEDQTLEQPDRWDGFIMFALWRHLFCFKEVALEGFVQDTFGKGGGHMFVVFIWCGSGGSVIELRNLDDYDDSFLTSSVSYVYQSFCTIHTKKPLSTTLICTPLRLLRHVAHNG